MPTPSLSRVPSESSENGRMDPSAERAGVLLKHMNMKMSLKVSTPPVMTTSERPAESSAAARWMAARELAQAASTTQFVPCRSRRLAIRPATTFPSRPGNEPSCQGT